MGPICTANPPPKQWPKTGAEVSRKNFEAFSLKWPFLVSKFLSVAGEGLVLGGPKMAKHAGGVPPKPRLYCQCSSYCSVFRVRLVASANYLVFHPSEAFSSGDHESPSKGA